MEEVLISGKVFDFVQRNATMQVYTQTTNLNIRITPQQHQMVSRSFTDENGSFWEQFQLTTAVLISLVPTGACKSWLHSAQLVPFVWKFSLASSAVHMNPVCARLGLPSFASAPHKWSDDRGRFVAESHSSTNTQNNMQMFPKLSCTETKNLTAPTCTVAECPRL